MDTRILNFNIKHSQRTYPVSLFNDTTISDLKRYIESLTKIPVGRQKYMIKGGLHPYETCETNIGEIIKPGSTVLLVGTPIEKRYHYNKNKDKMDSKTFRSPKVRCNSKISSIMPTTPKGIKNLGGTCSFNCVLQILYNMSSIREMILSYDNKREQNCFNTRAKSHQHLVSELKTCFQEIDKSESIIIPENLFKALQDCYPTECATLSNLNGSSDDKRCTVSILVDRIFKSLILVFADKFFNEVTIGLQSCDEEDEVLTYRQEMLKDSNPKFREFMATRLQCDFSDASTIVECLKKTFHAKDEKTIIRLPKYLTIEELTDPLHNTDDKCVCFPFRLNMYEFMETNYRIPKSQVTKTLQLYESFVCGDNDEDEECSSDGIPLDAKTAGYKSLFPTNLPTGENASTLYDLISVITEIKATGHYISYIRNRCNRDEWFKIDDDKVSVITSSQIKKCAGGKLGEQAVSLFYKGVGF
ncbi:deubiquitinating enzyme [Monosporozyma unispora]|nr:deubiquitinating enzyme [Kazachstania unispora]